MAQRSQKTINTKPEQTEVYCRTTVHRVPGRKWPNQRILSLTLQMVEASEVNSDNARATNSSSYEATAKADGK